ncbi:hypothetical protein AALP_AA8G058500 [Arabis alpina]|uniref:Mediator-associated protein 1 n=1 Tax=Arabis alpina TaxID=50452 RepID=A0A087G586_ARAAL|nr:hypothetical protein AALP_AA8G058500 [Arabis alpina]
MAPKHTDTIQNPPMPSSSSEEESASSGEDSDSSKKHNSASDSDPIKTKIVVTKPESSGSMKTTTKSSVVVAEPESTTAKRPLKETEEDVEVKKKKMKTELVMKNQEPEEKVSGDETKKQLMFQRLFSENDEIALLQGILDFTSTRGDPYEKMDVFCEYVKKLINFDANKSQLVTKIRRLKKKFGNTIKNSLKKGKSEDEIVFSKDLDQKAFHLSRKVWGSNGVLASKSRKKLGENSKEIIKKEEKPKQNVVSVCRSSSEGGEIASFFKAENTTAFGLDEPTVAARWEMVSDVAKKREMEEKLKKLKATQEELCLQRTGIVADTVKLIFNDNASSSSK